MAGRRTIGQIAAIGEPDPIDADARTRRIDDREVGDRAGATDGDRRVAFDGCGEVGPRAVGELARIQIDADREGLAQSLDGAEVLRGSGGAPELDAVLPLDQRMNECTPIDQLAAVGEFDAVAADAVEPVDQAEIGDGAGAARGNAGASFNDRRCILRRAVGKIAPVELDPNSRPTGAADRAVIGDRRGCPAGHDADASTGVVEVIPAFDLGREVSDGAVGEAPALVQVHSDGGLRNVGSAEIRVYRAQIDDAADR